MRTNTAPVTRHATAGITVRSIDAEKRSVRVVASTPAIDSYDEIVEQSWRLDRYRRNPVVLYAHNASGGLFGGNKPSDTLPVGRAEDVAVVAGQLEATIVFASRAANPLAEQCFQSFREGTLRAVSVGFRPGRVRSETRDGREVRVLSDNELFELSVVPIPANPEAVARSANGRAACAPSAEATLARLSPKLRAEAERVLRRDAPETFAECLHEFTMGDCPRFGCSHHWHTAERREHAAVLRAARPAPASTPTPAPVERELTLAELCSEPLSDPDPDVLMVLAAGCVPAPPETEQSNATPEADELTAHALQAIDMSETDFPDDAA